MSNSDGFIEEVTDEVRRDQLYIYLRRYGWIAIVCVLALVGGAAYNEYKKASVVAASQATGDALLNALGQDDSTERAAMLSEVATDGSAAGVAALLTAAAQQESGDAEAAVATLSVLATNTDVPSIYRELASFKSAMLQTTDNDARMQALDALSQPGQPFRLLALEQIAHAEIEGGDTDAAIATLEAILEDAAVSRGLQERAQTLMVALGAPLDAAATQ